MALDKRSSWVRRLGLAAMFALVTSAMLGAFNDAFAAGGRWLEGDGGRTAALIAIAGAALSGFYSITIFSIANMPRVPRR